jgi:transposase
MKKHTAELIISDQDNDKLDLISRSRTGPASRVQRAKILLMYSKGTAISDIARKLNTSRPLIYRVINKALAFGALQSLTDLKRPGRSRKIDDDAKKWVISVACQKPTEFGYAAETWTYTQLVKHIHDHASESGYQSLQKISRSKVHDILTGG